MNKLVVVAIALLVCAFVLGVGGVALHMNENAGVPIDASSAKSMSFCDPIVDPGCIPPGGSSFCDPIIDPGCIPGGGD